MNPQKLCIKLKKYPCAKKKEAILNYAMSSENYVLSYQMLALKVVTLTTVYRLACNPKNLPEGVI